MGGDAAVVGDLDAAAARRRKGVVRRDDLGTHPGREARARGLVPLQRETYIAATQPLGVLEALEGLREGPRSDFVVMGALALWLHVGGAVPPVGLVGVRHSQRLAVRPPLLRRRASDAVLRGRRVLRGFPVVALEVAVIQVAATLPPTDLLAVVEPLVRSRTTTLFRLRARCRRGLAGSAAVRRVCDELAGTSLEVAVRQLREGLEARGVTGLEVEVQFVSASGAIAYADLRLARRRISIEVDGFLDHAERNRFRTDRRRDRWLLKDHQETVLRVAADEVRDDLDALADELAAMLRDPPEQSAAG